GGARGAGKLRPDRREESRTREPSRAGGPAGWRHSRSAEGSRAALDPSPSVGRSLPPSAPRPSAPRPSAPTRLPRAPTRLRTRLVGVVAAQPLAQRHPEDLQIQLERPVF